MFLSQKALKTIHNIDIKKTEPPTLEYWKNIFLKNEKMANQKLRNLRNIIPSFLISEFSILPYSQNQKFGFKNLRKKFPRFPGFSRFPSFWPGLFFARSPYCGIGWPVLDKKVTLTGYFSFFLGHFTRNKNTQPTQRRRKVVIKTS